MRVIVRRNMAATHPACLSQRSTISADSVACFSILLKTILRARCRTSAMMGTTAFAFANIVDRIAVCCGGTRRGQQQQQEACYFYDLSSWMEDCFSKKGCNSTEPQHQARRFSSTGSNQRFGTLNRLHHQNENHDEEESLIDCFDSPSSVVFFHSLSKQFSLLLLTDIAMSSKKKQQQQETPERFDDSRPQFRRPPPSSVASSKVTVDARFAAVVTDPNFQTGGGGGGDNSAFYTVNDTDDGDPAAAQPKRNNKSQGTDVQHDTDRTTKRKPSTTKTEGEEDPASRIAYLTALSRGLVDDGSSSSSDGDSDDDEATAASMTAAKDEAIGVLDPSHNDIDSIPRTDDGDESPYLAVMQLDWDHIRAIDIVCILTSFTAPGAVRNVTVYLSDFGKEQLERDQLQGPGIWKTTTKNSTDEHAKEGDELSEHACDDNDDHSTSQAYDDDDDSSSQPPEETDFDPEKLRAYEASKLRYYFAVAEFTNAHYADVAYHQVDGLELDSGTAVDLRSIPVADRDSVIENRTVRDTASGSLPSTYEPPAIASSSSTAASSLQHSAVHCTWDTGDTERERLLTQYSTRTEKWAELAETGEPFTAYIASDASSSAGEGGEHSDDEANSDVENSKAGQMRKMLGLDSDGDEDDGDAADVDSEGDDEDKVATFVPGQQRGSTGKDTTTTKQDETEMLSPWEKYQQKRKEKRREKRAAARERRKAVGQMRRGEPPTSKTNDDFFLSADNDDTATSFSKHQKNSTEELELLVAGDGSDSADGRNNDYDMRGLERIQKVKDKKLRGARKRKEKQKAENVQGTEFAVDVADERFQAVLDGTDGRFGIDRTDARFRDTEGMHKILDEQTRRRRKTKRARAEVSNDAKSDDKRTAQATSLSLDNLVRNLKAKVKK